MICLRKKAEVKEAVVAKMKINHDNQIIDQNLQTVNRKPQLSPISGPFKPHRGILYQTSVYPYI